MTELYSSNEKCANYDFIELHFEDSTLLFLDSLKPTIMEDAKQAQSARPTIV